MRKDVEGDSDKAEMGKAESRNFILCAIFFVGVFDFWTVRASVSPRAGRGWLAEGREREVCQAPQIRMTKDEGRKKSEIRRPKSEGNPSLK